MAVEKQMTPADFDVEETDEVEIQVVNPEAVSIEADGEEVIIDFTGEFTEELIGPDHDANLAEYIEDDELGALASELVDDFVADRQSRKDWARSYVKGLDLLGMRIEERTQPWAGAAGVFHPVLTEAVVRFQAQAMSEIFPASGPVRTKVMGKKDQDTLAQAQRVQTEMNYLLTAEMSEDRDATYQMLLSLPFAGSAFKKVYYIPFIERPSSFFVSPES